MLAAAPAELVGALPREDASINMSFEEATQSGGKLFATAYRDSTPEALFVADGAGGLTRLFTSTRSPTGSFPEGITGLTALRGKAYFFANAAGGDGLYESDGTRTGTRAVRILRPNGPNVLPSQAFVLADRLYFFWTNLNQPTRLWRSDGTSGGTVAVLSLPADTYVTGISTVIQGSVFFSVTSGGGPGVGKLYRTDGTAAGTLPVWDFPDGLDVPKHFTVAGGKLFFINTGFSRSDLYVAKLDGTDVRKVNLPRTGNFEPSVESSFLTAVGDRVLFTAYTVGGQVAQLHSTDGTDAGTVKLAGGQVGVDPNRLGSPLAVAGGKAVLVQTSVDPAQRGLYVTDGTPAGTTRIVEATRTGQLGGFDVSAVRWFTEDGKAYYLAQNGGTGIRVYETDGTAAGTRPIHYVKAGGYSGGVAQRHLMTTVDGRPLIQIVSAGYPSLWSIDLDTPTGSILGMGYFDTNRNRVREGFESHLTGTAYLDVNDNGRFDPFDPAELGRQSSDGKRYVFDGLPPGHYIIRYRGYGIFEDAPITAPADGGAYRIDLGPGQNLSHADFGSAPQPEQTVIWGAVFNDADGDGARDPDEAGLAGQQVYLDRNGDGTYNGIDSIFFTAEDGTYGFAAAEAGTYIVRRRYAPGFRQTTPVGRAGVTVTVAARGVARADSIGVVVAASGAVTGTVFTDWSRNGVRDSEDTPHFDAQVYLDLNDNRAWDQGDEPQATTNRNGVFTFEGVVPGEYVVRLRPDYPSPLEIGGTLTEVSPPPGQGLPITVRSGATSEAGEFLVYDPFTPRPSGGISGSVWSDRDGDAVRDDSEFGIPGRTVWIDLDDDRQIDPHERRATTDTQGGYAFPNTAAGAYALRQALPAEGGWAQTSPAGGGARTVQLGEAEQATGVDFGARSTERSAPAVRQAVYSNPPDGGRGSTPASLRFFFTEDLGATLDASDLVLTDRATGREVPSMALEATLSGASIPVFRFPGLPGGALPAGDYRAVLKAGSVSDAAGNPLAEDFVFDFTASAAVTGRRTFYNNSLFDGHDPDATAADDAAIAPDKRASLSGNAADGFSHTTSFVRGLNGIMVDLAGLPEGAQMGADDFAFRVLMAGASGWADAPAPASVMVRPSAGSRGDRVTIIWPDGAIRNARLEVTVLATPDTGLARPDVFSFGNLVGETGDDNALRVSALDLAAVKQRLNAPSTLTGTHDFNRDGRVNALDLAAVRSNLNQALVFIAPPPPFFAPLKPLRAAEDLL